MAKVGIIGHGVVGSGVANILLNNADVLTARAGEKIELAKVCDLREFDVSYKHLFTKDAADIYTDPQIDIVVECMGGKGLAYKFVKAALENGKHVVTSNKELIAVCGTELEAIAQEKGVCLRYEASCGGGIPVIKPIAEDLGANHLTRVAGILNGTTNYILTNMTNDGKDFDTALREAQQKGYAELHPEADIEGYDACRKIAILSSLAYGCHISYKDILTEGITKVDEADIDYAKTMNCRIKLLATSRREKHGIWALVAPMVIGQENPLTTCDGVMNAVMVKGNAVGTTMYYGSGAGSLPTASAVVGDIIDCVKHRRTTIRTDYSAEPLMLIPVDEVTRPFFVRMRGDEGAARAAFGEISSVTRLPGKEDELGFLTAMMPEKEFKALLAGTDQVISWYRRGKNEEAEEA